MNHKIKSIQREIDRLLSQESRVLVAFDGGSAAGKSTLAEYFRSLYDCNIIHMDDFFLRPEQRTPQRFEEIGGNVDYERFFDEVLLPLLAGETFRYTPYDCHLQAMKESVTVFPKSLNIVEGTYSMHPVLSYAYDFSVFFKIGSQLQQKRILQRNGEEKQKLFLEKWIPLEKKYFCGTQIEKRCDLIFPMKRNFKNDIIKTL